MSNQNRLTPPSRYKIAKYWYELKKDNNPIYFKSPVDMNEPSCFACGYYKKRWDREDAEKAWNNTSLERAHIIGHYMGGSNDVSNFVLLCSYCHVKAPMTNKPEHMYTFINNKLQHSLEKQKELNDLNYMFGYDLEKKAYEVSKIIGQKKLKKEIFKQFEKLNIGTHFGDDGNGISVSSLFCAIHEVLLTF